MNERARRGAKKPSGKGQRGASRQKPGAQKHDPRRPRPEAEGAKKHDPRRPRPDAEGAKKRDPRRPRPEAAGAKKATAKPDKDDKPALRHDIPRLPERLPTEKAKLAPGAYLLTCRTGSEQDVIDELLLARVKQLPVQIASALVVAGDVPKRDKAPIPLTFARQGFPVAAFCRSGAGDVQELAEALAPALIERLRGKREYALHVWVPDSPEGNELSSQADALDGALSALLAEALPQSTRVDDAALRRVTTLPFAQVCLIDAQRAAAGVCYGNQAISLARGGRTRVRVTGELPSRAARKIEEALAWIGVSPGPSDVCVDLGAAPGGWTYVLSEKRARVIAVDPAKLRPDIAAKRNVRHVQDNAFTYAPDEPVTWLFCDMAYRPLEVAALLAKWGRRRWARILVANIKLPMKKKAEILSRVKRLLESEGDWKHVRAKQLYHDRDEITLTAYMG